MIKRFGWIVGTFIILIVLVAAEVSIISYVSKDDIKQKVVCAAVRIEKNTVITANMLEIREISSDAVHPEALGNIDEAVSMRAGMVIEAGEMLLKGKLFSRENDIIRARDANKRLISAEFRADQANAWQLVEDQYVDIIYVPNKADEEEQPPEAEGVVDASSEPNGVKMIKGIRIAGVIDEDAKKADIRETDSIPKYVSFEVTQEQAVFIAYAKNNGKLELCCIPEKSGNEGGQE